MAYTGKKHSNYIWIPKAKSDLKEYRDGLRLCRDLEDTTGSFNDIALGNLQVESGAIFNGSLMVEEYQAKYKTQQLGNQSYVSNARMLIRMCRFFGWIHRDAERKSTYYLTEKGRLISQFVGKFPRTCFKKQGMIPRCCGFVNPQRATAQGRGWVSQPIGLGNQAPTIDLTRFAKYGDNMPLNSGRPSGLRKKPSFEEKTRFQGK